MPAVVAWLVSVRSRFVSWLAICGGMSATSFGCSSSSFVMLDETLASWSVSASMPSSESKSDLNALQTGMSKQCGSQ